MLEFLSNYWIGLFILSPFAGVIWAAILNRNSNPKGSLFSEPKISQKAVVNGDGNTVTENNNSHNRKEVHNHFGGKPDDEPLNQGIVILGVSLMLVVSISWVFAKFGFPFLIVVLFLSVFIGLFIGVFLVSRFSFKDFDILDAPSSLIIIVIACLNAISAWTLKEQFRFEVSEIANSHENVINFFFALSHFGKALLVTQAISGIVIVMSLLFVLWRTYKLNADNTRWIPELVLALPFFGLFPYWLSNPDWSVNFILTAIP